MFLHLLKYNPHHDELGRFATLDEIAAGTTTDENFPKKAQTLAKNYNRPVTVADVFKELTPREVAGIEAMDRNLLEKQRQGQATNLTHTHNHDGKHYLPGRERMHRELLRDLKGQMLECQSPEGEAPLLTVLGGRGGSGKSQLDATKYPDIVGTGGYHYNAPGERKQFVIDSDMIKEELSKRANHGEWDGREAALWHEEADKIVQKLVDYARRNRINTVIDMTMKSDKTGKILSFRKAGFDLRGLYMFLPPLEAATRSARRALSPGGRYVPTDVIVGGNGNKGNYNNEINFDRLTRYFNKGYSIYNNMVGRDDNGKPLPPRLEVNVKEGNNLDLHPRKKGDFLSVLKFNPNHDDRGRFASGGLSNSDFNDTDRKIIDLKPGVRSMTSPTEVRTLASLIPGATYVPYTKLPFFDQMMKMQGTRIESSTGQEQKSARDALLVKQPVETVPLKGLVFTQNVVNYKAVQNFKNINTKPVQVARHEGKLYLLDGHHRVAFEAVQGTTGIDAHVLDLDQLRTRKYNPNHDERGRFAVAGYGQGVEFVSPNVNEGLDINRARDAVTDFRHQDVLAIAGEVDALLGLRTKHESGVGAWSDGAENTLMGRVYGNPTYEQIKLSAAMKGMLADQKAVIPFKVGDGPDSLYKIKMPVAGMGVIHDNLSKAGLEFHTMVQHKDHTDVYVFDPGTQLKEKVQEAGAKHGIEISQWKGRGEFLGSWDSRQEGRDTYEAVIDANLGQDRRGAWDRLYSGWRKTHAVLKGLIVSTFSGMLKAEVRWANKD